MLLEALGAPMRSQDSVGTLIVGGGLLLFSALFPFVWLFALSVSVIWLVLAPLAVFPPLVALGYDLRAMESGLRDRRAVQPFVGWSELAWNGARSLLLRFVYLLPTIVAVAGAWGVLSGVDGSLSGQPEELRAAATAFVVGVTALLVMTHLVVYLYVWPAGLAVLAATGRLRSALSPRIVAPVALSNGYARGWIVATLIVGIGLVVTVPLVLVVVGFVVAFYVRTVSVYVYGTGARGTVPDLEPTSRDGTEQGSTTSQPVAATTASSAGTISSSVETTNSSSTRPTTPPSTRPTTPPSTRPTNSSSTRTVMTTATTAERDEGTIEPNPAAPTSWSPRVEPEPSPHIQVGRTVPEEADLDDSVDRGESVDRGDSVDRDDSIDRCHEGDDHDSDRDRSDTNGNSPGHGSTPESEY